MSAAATAAGYLYASGRLRGRAAREQDQQEGHSAELEKRQEKRQEKKPARRETRVAVLPEHTEPRPEQPRKTPKIEYRRKRWAPE
jgi:hypothetical protein